MQQNRNAVNQQCISCKLVLGHRPVVHHRTCDLSGLSWNHVSSSWRRLKSSTKVRRLQRADDIHVSSAYRWGNWLWQRRQPAEMTPNTNQRSTPQKRYPMDNPGNPRPDRYRKPKRNYAKVHLERIFTVDHIKTSWQIQEDEECGIAISARPNPDCGGGRRSDDVK